MNKRFETRVQNSANRKRSTRRHGIRAHRRDFSRALLVYRRDRIMMKNKKLSYFQNWLVDLNPLPIKVILKYELREREN